MTRWTQADIDSFSKRTGVKLKVYNLNEFLAKDFPFRANIFISGNPAAQGSKRHVGNGRMIEASKKLKPWRKTVTDRLLIEYKSPRMTGAVEVKLAFVMPRPKNTPKDTPPAIKRTGDIDKLSRAVLDAITDAGIWIDDAQVISLIATKRLASQDEESGVQVSIKPITD